jgi:hypothetical protein
MPKVPFSKIKPGSFFRVKGKALCQRRRDDHSSYQYVTGARTGSVEWPSPIALVTPVNASIVEEK